MKINLTCPALLLCLGAFTQTPPLIPSIQWQKSLGGKRSDYASAIQQTFDSGYIVAGYSDSNDGDVRGNHGGYDYWIVKLNKKGTIQWQKTLGGSSEDYANSIQQTSDNGYIVAGYSLSNDGDVSGNHGSYDYWIVKLNKKGEIQWQKSLGGSSEEGANSIQQTPDNGYIVAGFSFSNDGDVSGNHGDGDCWIVKLNKEGEIKWQKSLGGSNRDFAYSIQQTFDSGYVVAGSSISNDGDVSGNHGSSDSWIVKLNKKGNIQWQKSLGGSGFDLATSMQQTSDSGYIVAGGSDSNDGDVRGNHGDYDCWVVKLHKKGWIQWQKSLGGGNYDFATSIQQTFNGTYIVAGYSYSNDGDVSGNHGRGDYWVVRLSKKGGIRRQKTLGGSRDDYAYSIQQTSDSGFIVAGYSYSKDGNVSGHHGLTRFSDYWILKLKGNTTTFRSVSSDPVGEASVRNALKELNKDFTAYPNPAKDVLYIQTTGSGMFSLINASGKILLTKNITGNGSINISTLPPGFYYLENNETGKLQKVMISR